MPISKSTYSCVKHGSTTITLFIYINSSNSRGRVKLEQSGILLVYRVVALLADMLINRLVEDGYSHAGCEVQL